MISKDNLISVLTPLGFTKSSSTFAKTFGAATLAINFAKGEIIYPEAQGLKVNERQTCNFSANENFVVFECVHRLLEKGYKPEHIELEPKWKLGLGASGGRADILIRDNAKTPLLIIECKTPGREFDKAWRNTLQDGDQLFSYAQQIPETQFLCLYCADFSSDDKVTYQSNIIAYRDNEKYLEDNPSFKGFKEPGDAKFKYSIWRDTYKLDYATKGIFEDNIQPYHIGKDKYTIADLQTISADDQQKKYHEFATILRQHNVSGRENAFDKLVNLFLCKLVDETENLKLDPAKQELKFYWKGVAYDSHFDLMDRLQQLYQAGMGKFLGEAITYIDQNAVKNAMRFIRQNPDATQRAVWHLFLQQKFFTNNDFSFIDVHNEKLFYQNAEVLLKILQMWQDIRLTNDNGHNQFLGDLFEGFLDQGIKQSEGQYFTPIPICRFMLMSLPLESIVKNRANPPKAIDYACGAGHFLTELALQLKPLVARHRQSDMADYHRAVYGMEKEYRLSKVAKVSAFMYGQHEINICYGDALVKSHTAFPNIEDNSFDLLVANPPFSVKGFLETLPEEERNNYTLSETIDKLDTNNSIETFFIERAKQLLKAGGVAGIILPSSILSNGGTTYVRTREILLQYFDIVAIAEFGSGTFGKTGTNTVMLFLRRKGTAPDSAEHYRERVNEWFKGCENNKRKQVIYEDAHLIDQYAAHIVVPAEDYKTLLAGKPNADLLAHEIFVQYRAAFDHSTEITNLLKQKGFKALSKADQKAELEKRFLSFMQTIERDKLYHFVMASQQPNQVLIIKSPTDNKAQKQFLGYDWSSAKGDEGIKLIKDSHGRHLTPLYDETDRDNATKLNHYTAANFDNALTEIPAELASYAIAARLVDMLDFSRVNFEKQISLINRKQVDVQSKWPLIKLGDYVESMGGLWTGKKPPFRSVRVIRNTNFAKDGNLDLSDVALIRVEEKQFITRTLKQGDIIVEKSGGSETQAVGRVVIFKEKSDEYSFSNFTARIRVSNNSLSASYLHIWLNYYYQAGFTFAMQSGSSGLKNLDFTRYLEIKFPLPPLKIQQQIVKECKAVDAEVYTAKKNINTAEHSIETAVVNIIIKSYTNSKLGDMSISHINPSKTEIKNVDDATLVSFVEMAAVSETGYIISMEDRPLKELRKGSYTYFAENDIIVAKITPCMENGKCAIASGLTNNLGMGSSEFHVIRVNQENVLPKYLFALLNRQAVRTEAEKVMTGASGHRRVPASFYENLQIPVPPLAEQKRLVAEIEKLEKTIADAQALIASAPARKQAIMQRYL